MDVVDLCRCRRLDMIGMHMFEQVFSGQAQHQNWLCSLETKYGNISCTLVLLLIYRLILNMYLQSMSNGSSLLD